ncbi:hypothetical protein TNCV_881621 [Trichonephila clavipes]|nr:hypothetical protein TNCV_881621 [Trichonephila clavipes]
MDEVRWEFAPGKVILDVKVIPLCSTKISRHWSQDRLLPFGAPILISTEVAHFLHHMSSILDAASSDAQTNQGWALGLGKETRSSSNLQSLQALKILQCNINDLSILTTRTKLDQFLEIVDLRTKFKYNRYTGDKVKGNYSS